MRFYLGFGLALVGGIILFVFLFTGLVRSTPGNNRFWDGLAVGGFFLLVGIANIWGGLADREKRRPDER